MRTAPSAVGESVSSDTVSHLDFLDAIRGILALYIVLHHAWSFSFGMAAQSGTLGALSNWLLYGHLAVDAFIVLSGFCLGLPVFSKYGAARFETLAFYKKRLRRIYPPFFYALLLAIILYVIDSAFVEGSGIVPKELVYSVLANAFLLQDWLVDTNIFNGPFWSVAVEAKIYFIFPVLVWLYARFGIVVMMVAPMLLALLLTLLCRRFIPVEDMGHACPWYVALFAFGLCGAWFRKTCCTNGKDGYTRIIFWIGSVSLIASLLLVWTFPVVESGEFELFVPHLPYIDVAFGIFVSSLLVCVAVGGIKSKLERSAVWRPLVHVGGFAYSIYLTHYLVLGYLANIFQCLWGEGQYADPYSYALIGLGVPLSLVFAYLFYCFCERPFLTNLARQPRASAIASR